MVAHLNDATSSRSPLFTEWTMADAVPRECSQPGARLKRSWPVLRHNFCWPIRQRSRVIFEHFAASRLEHDSRGGLERIGRSDQFHRSHSRCCSRCQRQGAWGTTPTPSPTALVARARSRSKGSFASSKFSNPAESRAFPLFPPLSDSLARINENSSNYLSNLTRISYRLCFIRR